MKLRRIRKNGLGTPVEDILLGWNETHSEWRKAVSLRSLLTATALATIIAAAGYASSVYAQVAPSMGGREPVDQQKGVQTPETLGAGRSMAGPEGTELARPADPHVQPQGPRQPATGKQGDTSATNVKPPPGSSDQPSGSSDTSRSNTESAVPLPKTSKQ